MGAGASSTLKDKKFEIASQDRSELKELFEPLEGDVPAEAWVGTLVDCFSPDYDTAERQPWETNPESRRFVDVVGDELCISGDHGEDNKWGRRFDATTDVNPVLTPVPGEAAAMRTTNFLCKVPADAPVRKDAEMGALKFIVTLGTVKGVKCLRWSTTFLGLGGKFGDNMFPPDEAENYWVYVPEAAPAPAA